MRHDTYVKLRISKPRTEGLTMQLKGRPSVQCSGGGGNLTLYKPIVKILSKHQNFLGAGEIVQQERI